MQPVLRTCVNRVEIFIQTAGLEGNIWNDNLSPRLGSPHGSPHPSQSIQMYTIPSILLSHIPLNRMGSECWDSVHLDILTGMGEPWGLPSLGDKFSFHMFPSK